MPSSSVYQAIAADRSSAKKLTVVSPRNMGVPFVGLRWLTTPMLAPKVLTN